MVKRSVNLEPNLYKKGQVNQRASGSRMSTGVLDKTSQWTPADSIFISQMNEYFKKTKDLGLFERTVSDVTDNLRESACKSIEQQIQLLEQRDAQQGRRPMRYGGAVEVSEFDGGAPSMAGESMTIRARKDKSSFKQVQVNKGDTKESFDQSQTRPSKLGEDFQSVFIRATTQHKTELQDQQNLEEEIGTKEKVVQEFGTQKQSNHGYHRSESFMKRQRKDFLRKIAADIALTLLKYVSSVVANQCEEKMMEQTFKIAALNRGKRKSINGSPFDQNMIFGQSNNFDEGLGLPYPMSKENSPKVNHFSQTPKISSRAVFILRMKEKHFKQVVHTSMERKQLFSAPIGKLPRAKLSLTPVIIEPKNSSQIGSSLDIRDSVAPSSLRKSNGFPNNINRSRVEKSDLSTMDYTNNPLKARSVLNRTAKISNQHNSSLQQESSLYQSIGRNSPNTSFDMPPNDEIPNEAILSVSIDNQLLKQRIQRGLKLAPYTGQSQRFGIKASQRYSPKLNIDIDRVKESN